MDSVDTLVFFWGVYFLKDSDILHRCFVDSLKSWSFVAICNEDTFTVFCFVFSNPAGGCPNFFCFLPN